MHLRNQMAPMSFAAALTGALSITTCLAFAAPQGKAWAPVEILRLPGHSWVAPQFLDTGSNGAPTAVVQGIGGSGQDLHEINWRDSTWVSSFALGHGVGFARPVVRGGSERSVVWQEFEIADPDSVRSYLVYADICSASFCRLDSVALTAPESFAYAAARAGSIAWVAKSARGLIRTYRREADSWNELQIAGNGGNGVAIAATSDTSAVLVWTSASGLEVARLTPPSVSLVPSGALPGTPPGSPRLRLNSAGGQWLAWGTSENFVALAALDDDGAMLSLDSLRCAYTQPGVYLSAAVDASRDTAPRPAIAWSASNSASSIPTICACVPGSDGYGLADNLSGSDGGILPSVAVDLNGDAWVAWWTENFDGMYWTHTYTRATVSKIQLASIAAGPRIQWTLSESAPSSVWSVHRRVDYGPFVQAARVRATSGVQLSWVDSGLTAGSTAEYRIRRESVDVNYAVSSASVRTRLTTATLSLHNLTGSPLTSGSLQLSVLGARAGDLRIEVFDLQGRKVVDHRTTASGAGRDDTALDAGHLKPAIYLLRATDAAGERSRSIKLAVLR